MAGEHVVVVDGLGVPIGSIPKQNAHSDSTPLHLAFSCYAVRPDGAVLLARRADHKVTWPGVWSNACCGHPQLGETLRAAVTRRLREELGLRPDQLALALPDFAYRARMDDGTVEHELCPVVIASVDGRVRPNPSEVSATSWICWDALRERASCAPETLSPWMVEQVAELDHLGGSPESWLRNASRRPSRALDRQVSVCPTRNGSEARRDEANPVRADVEAVLASFLCAKRDHLRSIDGDLVPLVREIAGLIEAGGKRLRPAFVYWGHRATGAAHDEAIVRVAAAVELLHTFALIHDDVMDRSATRRSRPSAHVSFAALHRCRSMAGDGSWFGASAAMLAGDLAHVWAEEMLASARLGDGAALRARGIFTELREEVMAGQFLDLQLGGATTADEWIARRVALLKSARYSVTQPLLLGASAGSVPPCGRLRAALETYGDAIGLAFQMRDDLLGLFGDPARTGKSALDDLREGKRTVLILRALRLCDESGRRVIETALGDPALDEARAEVVRDVVASSGAAASVELLVRDKHDEALRAIDGLPSDARSALTVLAEQALSRDR